MGWVEGWMINIVMSVITFIALFVTIKVKQENQQKTIDDICNRIDTIYSRLDKHGDDIVKLNTKSELAVTAKDVDDKYVSKEYFRQFEKHIDTHFKRLEDGQDKILAYVEQSNRVAR